MNDIQLISNRDDYNFFDSLKNNLENCSEFKMSVAFISWGGIQNFFPIFEELEKKNIKGQILTTTYEDFTKPEVLQKIHSYKNLELKIYVPKNEKEGFHTKGYLFQNCNQWTIIIGSSNITERALKHNQEWNLSKTEELIKDKESYKPGYFAKSVLEEFERLWESPFAEEFTDDFLNEYREYLISNKEKQLQIQRSKNHTFFTYRSKKDTDLQIIEPNRMQQEAIANLAKLRNSGIKKALAVAATGSGKTYLAAFDVAMQFKPKHMLFIVHRDNILEKACDSFKQILLKDDSEFGFYNGNEKCPKCKYVFASTNTLLRHYEEFDKEEFDYIILDEAHHATTPGNQKILNWFKPQFLLGLTATPERMDGDVFSVFDNHVAVEIRLRDALKYDLVCPFNYFALSDVEGIDYTKLKRKPGEDGYLDEVAKMLAIGKRVDYVIEKIKYYGHDGQKAKVLGFCANIEHADYMAREFNNRLGKNKAISLNGTDDDTERRQFYIDKLEDDSDELSYIFTVNIFNEGVDIPSVNTILMLRPTQSAIVFIQQLGRGLRKLENKEFLTVLDFVGNYQKSFLLAVAFNGKPGTNKRKLQKQVKEDFKDLPNAFIHMDPIIKEQILRQLEKEKFMTLVNMTEEYFTFKRLNCGNTVPFLIDFLKPGLNIDPLNFCKIHSKKTKKLIPSYIHFICEVDNENTKELNDVLLVEEFNLFITFISTFMPAVRIDEWCILDCLIKAENNNYSVSLIKIYEEERKYVDINHSNNLMHACEVLSGKHSDSKEIPTYKNIFCKYDGKTISLNENLIKQIQTHKLSSLFITWVSDIIKYSIIRYTNEFGRDDYGYPFLKLYHGYSQKQQAITSNYSKSISAFRGDGLNTNLEKDYFIFVDLYKDENIREEINYDDQFLTQREMQWQSPNDSVQAKGSGYKVIHNIKLNINLHLFVRKYKEIEKIPQPYIYLGKVHTHKDSAKGDKPITLIFTLENEIPKELYEDFKTNEKYIEIEEDKK